MPDGECGRRMRRRRGCGRLTLLVENVLWRNGLIWGLDSTLLEVQMVLMRSEVSIYGRGLAAFGSVAAGVIPNHPDASM